MSKPIFIIRFPIEIKIEKLIEWNQELENKLHDYHVLGIIDSSVDKVEFECYNSPHTEIEFEQLKNKVYEMLYID